MEQFSQLPLLVWNEYFVPIDGGLIKVGQWVFWNGDIEVCEVRIIKGV